MHPVALHGTRHYQHYTLLLGWHVLVHIRTHACTPCTPFCSRPSGKRDRKELGGCDHAHSPWAQTPVHYVRPSLVISEFNSFSLTHTTLQHVCAHSVRLLHSTSGLVWAVHKQRVGESHMCV